MKIQKSANNYVEKNALFGERFKNLRKQNNESQDELANILETNRNSIARYEKGIMPHGQMLIKIAKHYNISLDYLCSLTDNNESILANIDKLKELADKIANQYLEDKNKQ